MRVTRLTRTNRTPLGERGSMRNRRHTRVIVGVAWTAAVAMGCPGDRRDKGADSARAAIPVDTMPTDLSKVEASLPPTLPDTFKRPARARRATNTVVREPPIPPAPPALMEAVSRERSFSRFCYQEFGQKVDPALTGGVALVVTVGAAGITDAKVASDSWSSNAGKSVNRCLDEKAGSAWKLAGGAVSAGKYVVRMTFTGR
jgi:hypothetical protein